MPAHGIAPGVCVPCLPAGWLAGWPAGWLAAWLAGCLAAWLPGWLAGWLAASGPAPDLRAGP
eukprot:11942304-Alexandrium_andersonii.AAC.1